MHDLIELAITLLSWALFPATLYVGWGLWQTRRRLQEQRAAVEADLHSLGSLRFSAIFRSREVQIEIAKVACVFLCACLVLFPVGELIAMDVRRLLLRVLLLILICLILITKNNSAHYWPELARRVHQELQEERKKQEIRRVL